MSNPLIQFYKSLLSSVDIGPNTAGKLHYINLSDEKDVPISLTYYDINEEPVEGELYIPYDKVYNREDPKIIKFHPTSEKLYRRNSEVLGFLHKQINAKLNNTVVSLLMTLVTIAADRTNKKSMPTNAFELLTQLGLVDVNEKDVKYMARVTSKVLTQPDLSFINLAINRNGGKDSDGIQKKRLCFSKSLVCQSHIDEDELKIVGVKAPSKRAFYKVSAAILELVGTIDVSEGSNLNTHPAFESLLKAYAQTAVALNKVAADVWDNIPDSYKTQCVIGLDWAGDIKKLEKWHIKYLNFDFPGNIGRSAPDANKVSKKTNTSVAKPTTSVSTVGWDTEPVEQVEDNIDDVSDLGDAHNARMESIRKKNQARERLKATYNAKVTGTVQPPPNNHVNGGQSQQPQYQHQTAPATHPVTTTRPEEMSLSERIAAKAMMPDPVVYQNQAVNMQGGMPVYQQPQYQQPVQQQFVGGHNPRMPIYAQHPVMNPNAGYGHQVPSTQYGNVQVATPQQINDANAPFKY